jgi:predicted transcriptional regulator
MNGSQDPERAKSQIRQARRVDPSLLEEVVGRISNTLSVKVRVKGTREKGQITINYGSEEQLEQLLSQFKK